MDRAYCLLEIKSIDDDARTFEGIASTPEIDHGGDSMDPFGAEFTLPMPLKWEHGKGAIKDPVGWITHATPTEHGIPVKGRFAKVDSPASLRDDLDRAFALVKAGLVRGLSIGWTPRQGEPIKGGFTRWRKWGWHETSAVAIGMNSGATIHAIKSIDAQTLAALGQRRERASNDSTPGATGQRLKGSNVKTYAERLKDLQDTRAEKAAIIKQLAEKCGGDFDTLDENELDTYREAAVDVKQYDVKIKDVEGAIQAIDGAIAIPQGAGTDPTRATNLRRGRVDPPLKEKQLEKGIAYAQYLRLMYHAKGMPIMALQMAERQRGLDPRVAMQLKGDVEAGSVTGTTTAGNWGMELVGSETGVMADFLEFLRPQTILGKFGTGGVPSLSRVPFRVPFGAATSGGTAYWTGEGKAKPLTKFGFSRDHLEPLKITAMCAVTMELLRDSSPAADGLLRNLLSGAITERENIDFIDPDKTVDAGNSPASITNGITPVAATGTGDADDVRTDVKAAFASFLAASNPPTSGVWVMSASTALSLSLMMNALGQPAFPGITMNGGTFAGLPVITSEYMPSVTAGPFVVLLNARDIFFNDLGGIQIDTSEHASLEMLDNPGANSTTPTAATGNMVSMFQTNSVAFRAEITVDWVRARDSGVYVISGVAWGNA